MSKSIRNFLIGIALLGLGAQVLAQDDVNCSGCVDTGDIASQAVTTGRIANQAVTRSKIAPEAVTTPKIGPGAVTTGRIAIQAVTRSRIAPDAVTTPKIQDGAVTMDKLASEVLNSLSSGDVNFRGVFVNGRTEGLRQVVGAVAFDTSECSRWLNFTEDLRGGNFNTITLSGSLGGPFTCTDPVAANLIADALNSGANSSTVCDGRDWNTSGLGGTGRRLSLDSSVGTCTDQPAIRACIGNRNWGGLGGVTCDAPNQSINLIFQR